MLPVRLYSIFPHHLINGTLKRKILNIKFVLWFFFIERLSEKLCILKRTEWNTTTICVLDVMYVTCYSCPVFMKLQISQRIFEKYSYFKIFMRIHPVGAELFHADERTDRQTDTTKLIVAFRNFANVPKHSTVCPQFTHKCFVFMDLRTSTNFFPVQY
jgi:hypothetical protein